MSSSIFGWAYPAGCCGPPDGDDLSPLQEAVLGLCEKRGFNAAALERVQAVLLEEEGSLVQQEYEAQAEAEYEENAELDRIYWAQQAAAEPRQ